MEATRPARERTLTLTVAIASILSSGERRHEQHHLAYRSNRSRPCDPVFPRIALRQFACLQGSPHRCCCPAALPYSALERPPIPYSMRARTTEAMFANARVPTRAGMTGTRRRGAPTRSGASSRSTRRERRMAIALFSNGFCGPYNGSNILLPRCAGAQRS